MVVTEISNTKSLKLPTEQVTANGGRGRKRSYRNS